MVLGAAPVHMGATRGTIRKTKQMARLPAKVSEQLVAGLIKLVSQVAMRGITKTTPNTQPAIAQVIHINEWQLSPAHELHSHHAG